MFSKSLMQIRSRLRATAGLAAWALAAILAALAGICWLSAALFIWLLGTYTPLAACAIMGAVFIALTALLALGAWFSRKAGQDRQEEIELASRPARGWVNPSTVSAGLDMAQMVGGRRASTMLAGAIAVAWLLGHLAQSSDTATSTDDPS